MTKLMDIKGFWNMNGNQSFNDNNMWEGKILLEDDGWFEGIVVDSNSSYKGNRFIFGVYFPEKMIELYKVTPSIGIAPLVFHGIRDVKGYDGEFECVGMFESTPCGVSHIITQYSTLDKNNMDIEIEKLKKKIELYKGTLLNEITEVFYTKYLSSRKALCTYFERRINGDNLTEEEWDNYIDGLIVEDEEQELKVKQLLPDGDLPF